MRMTQAERDAAWACGHECHPGAWIGEKAAPEQERVWESIRQETAAREASRLTSINFTQRSE